MTVIILILILDRYLRKPIIQLLKKNTMRWPYSYDNKTPVTTVHGPWVEERGGRLGTENVTRITDTSDGGNSDHGYK